MAVRKDGGFLDRVLFFCFWVFLGFDCGFEVVIGLVGFLSCWGLGTWLHSGPCSDKSFVGIASSKYVCLFLYSHKILNFFL